MEEILRKENIKLDLAAESKMDVLKKLSELLFENGEIENAEAFFEDVMERESLGFTGAGNQIAIPHGISDQVNKVVLAAAALTDPVIWDTKQQDIPEESKAVRLVILFAVPKDPPADKEAAYIRVLKRVCVKLADAKSLQKLLAAVSASQIMDIINGE
ncbi:MAG TPA: PTS sugar transporter subunit IIA [Lachnospiraceae bacterium]|nr:PTS sugar transporter subunit IIA [Lachnospiraceae bacterium]